jgi:hypothetical protein
MSRVRRFCALILVLSALRPAYADVHFRHFEEDPDEPKWQEGEVTLPEFPKEESLQEFYVSAGTANRFYVDGKSIAVGSDGVVRFTLVVKTAGGATNTSYEGIRCGALETRLYAVGRGDGTWVKARTSAWKPIENNPINRPHAALSRDFFCPSMIPINSPEEGRNALRLGKHPDAK